MPQQCVLLPLLVFACAWTASAVELHVAVTGNDIAPGTAQQPLRTIQHAADLAQPGDTVTVHAGIYRERVDPPRGGESDTKRITYQAAPGERVEIRGSEVVTGWTLVKDRVWKAVIPNARFAGFNPFADEISGPWFNPDPSAKNKTKVVDDGTKSATVAIQKHHTGSVYINGRWLAEAKDLERVFTPTDKLGWWFAEVGPESTTVHADFGDQDPTQQEIEVNVRQSVFYPSRNGIDFVTVRGFILRDAATPWAPPTAEQIGVIGTNWSRGWIIEKNEIRNAACSGVTLGKYHSDQDVELGSGPGYEKQIVMSRTHTIPWSRDRIGHHVVRDNLIEVCGQAGICGSLGGAFSTITGNVIRDIWVRRRFGGMEQGGIKLHGGIDAVITNNHIYRTPLGIWLDWMAQGARVSRNLLHDNGRDVFIEASHGPTLLDNNIMLSRTTAFLNAQGCAYVHNLMVGRLEIHFKDGRNTPLLQPYSTAHVSNENFPHGDQRFVNNWFGPGTRIGDIPKRRMPDLLAGNVYVGDATPRDDEPSPLLLAETTADQVRLEQRPEGFFLKITVDPALTSSDRTRLVTTEGLGLAVLPKQGYTNPDGSPLRIDVDYFGKPRDTQHPTPGPFEKPGKGQIELKVAEMR
jgi:alpha-N-arabinofuranosidase